MCNEMSGNDLYICYEWKSVFLFDFIILKNNKEVVVLDLFLLQFNLFFFISTFCFSLFRTESNIKTELKKFVFSCYIFEVKMTFFSFVLK